MSEASRWNVGRWIAVIAIAGSTWACIPWVHWENDTPAIEGTLVQGGVAMRATELEVVSGDGSAECDGKTTHAVTGDDGTFRFEPQRRRDFTLVVMGHRFHRWSLCIEDDGGWRPLLVAEDYALGDTGPYWNAVLRCDVERPDGDECRLGDGNSQPCEPPAFTHCQRPIRH